MKAVEASLAHRSLGAIHYWVGRAGRDSFTGQTLSRLSRAAGPAFADSRVVGSARITSSTIEDGALPMSVSAVGRPSMALSAALSLGPGGRLGQSMGTAVRSSTFRGGVWLRPLGAGLLGLGCGLLFSPFAASIVLILTGLLLVVLGPLAFTAGRGSRLVGWAGSLVDEDRARTVVPEPSFERAKAAGYEGSKATTRPSTDRLTWAAMLLAAAAGVMAGASPGGGAKEVVAFVVVIAAFAGLLYRPEAILLLVAAFPWIDWAVRDSLGVLGPIWDDALLLVSLALILWSVLVLGRTRARTVPITLPVLAMAAAAVGSIVIRKVPNDVGLYALRVLFEPILFYFVGFLLPKSIRWVRWTIWVFLAASTALALHGLYQYLTHAPTPANWVDVTETSITTRAYSVVQNPNVLGAFLCMGVLVSGSLALSRAFQGSRRLLLAAMCLLQIAGIAVTFSRGAWLGLVVGALAVVLIAYRRYLLAFVGAAIVAWFAAPRVFIDRLVFSFSSAYVDRSTSGLGRIYRWGVALDHIGDHPLFGMGLGTFGGTSAYMFGYWALWVDNFYLQMAAEGGILLLLFFLWLLVRGAKGLVRGHRVARDAYQKALTAGMFGAFLAVIAANAFEADWETLAVGVEFWFLAGLVTSAALTLSPSEEGAPGAVADAGLGPTARRGGTSPGTTGSPADGPDGKVQ